jgi:MerR family copper efflux transcriptional regulator
MWQAHARNGDRDKERPERCRSAHADILACPKRGLDLEPGFNVYSLAMTTYRISDAARRTGLSTSTLRYYERIGLLPAPERSNSGYRAYEERALDRLTFIARAKDLGLRLEDIGGLADLWDSERCGPVQERLRELITARIAETEEQAAALTTLSAELSSFITGLESPAPDEPCGPECGCHATTSRSLTMLPTVGPDVACSLNGEDQETRLGEWQALAGEATRRTPIEGGIRLTFATADLPAMADLVAREQGCCSFLSFAIGVTPAATTLDITGPADARPLIEALA